MKNTFAFSILLSLITLIYACSSETRTDDYSDNTVQEEITHQAVEKITEENTFFGTYELSGMIPVLGDKKLTPQDEKYISDSKKRTLGKTELTFNEDGTFTRIFPHPSGDGTMNTWTGTYKMDEELGKLNMVAEMNGKSMPIEFNIIEISENQLILETDFGQIYMKYIYDKK